MNHELGEALAHLKAALREADQAQMGDGFMEAVARHALTTRTCAPWGASIPEDIFRIYALFPRVNNERLTFYHEAIASALKPRLQGLSMREAALEVNHWCFEQATYRSTDRRTASPLAVMRAGLARCGEESTLAVSAMRAVGIPARQCYVPRWAHCDDNHAWVEVWIDGAWHYMGACEPEMLLDSGWFTAAASRAMLVHTRAYGMPPIGERVEAVSVREFTINRTDAYAPTALLKVQVMDHGAPKPGAKVLFELCNMAEFFPICVKPTGQNGEVDLMTGLGSLRVRVLDGDRSVWALVDVREQRDCVLDLKDAVALEPGARHFRLIPPAETRIQPVPEPGPALEGHLERLRQASRLREARLAGWKTGEPYADRAGGNAQEIRAFLADGRYVETDKQLLLDTLSEKDFFDVDLTILEDALEGALPWRAAFEDSVWQKYLLCPRVAYEERYPIRRALAKALGGLKTPREIYEFVAKAVSVKELAPPEVFPDSLTALSCGFTSAEGLNILFVDACRALGIPARLNPATGAVEFYENGGFAPLHTPAAFAAASLTLVSYEPLKYYERFTLSMVEGGRERTLDFEGVTLDGRRTFRLRPGDYRLTVVTRQIDGTVDGTVTPLALSPDKALELRVQPPPDGTRERLLNAELPPLLAISPDGQLRTLPQPRRRALIAFLAPGEEPTEHFLAELSERKADFVSRGIDVMLVVDEPSKEGRSRLRAALSDFSGAEVLVSQDAAALIAWHGALRCGDLRKPFAAAVDGDGKGLFAFSNYFVGSVRALLGILDFAPDHDEKWEGNS